MLPIIPTVGNQSLPSISVHTVQTFDPPTTSALRAGIFAFTFPRRFPGPAKRQSCQGVPDDHFRFHPISLHPSLNSISLMSDDKTKTGSPDRDRINIHEDYEKRDWAKKFGVSEERLEQAVKKVGTNAKDVQKELGK